jgi:hypothetical protein
VKATASKPAKTAKKTAKAAVIPPVQDDEGDSESPIPESRPVREASKAVKALLTCINLEDEQEETDEENGEIIDVDEYEETANSEDDHGTGGSAVDPKTANPPNRLDDDDEFRIFDADFEHEMSKIRVKPAKKRQAKKVVEESESETDTEGM